MKARRLPGVRCSTLKTECRSLLCLMIMPGRSCVAGIDIAEKLSLIQLWFAEPTEGGQATSSAATGRVKGYFTRSCAGKETFPIRHSSDSNAIFRGCTAGPRGIESILNSHAAPCYAFGDLAEKEVYDAHWKLRVFRKQQRWNSHHVSSHRPGRRSPGWPAARPKNWQADAPRPETRLRRRQRHGR